MTDTVKHIGIGVLAAVLIFGGGFASGRFSTPSKVVEKTSIQYVDRQIVVKQEHETIKIQKVYLKQSALHTHKEEHDVSHPDGTKEAFKVEDTNVQTVVNSHDIQYVDRDILKTVEHTTVQQQTVEKTVESKKPDWLISVKVGVDFSHVSNGLIYGGEVDRRILGPAYLGLWGLSNKTVGASGGLQF